MVGCPLSNSGRSNSVAFALPANLWIHLRLLFLQTDPKEKRYENREASTAEPFATHQKFPELAGYREGRSDGGARMWGERQSAATNPLA